MVLSVAFSSDPETCLLYTSLMMGTRCGSIDPATVCYLQREGGYSYQEVDDMMNKQSGLLAISGISNDARDIRTRASEGDERCLLAFDMFAYKAMQQALSLIHI